MGGLPSSAGRLLCVFASLSSALMFDCVVCLGVLVVGLYVCPHCVFVGRRVRGSVGVHVVPVSCWCTIVECSKLNGLYMSCIASSIGPC